MKAYPIAVITAILLLILSGMQTLSAKPASLKLGVVNLQQVLDTSETIGKMQKKFYAQNRPLETKLNQETAHLAQLRKQLPKAKDKSDIKKQIAVSRAEFQKTLADFNTLQQSQQDQIKAVLNAAFDKVSAKEDLGGILLKVAVVQQGPIFKEVTEQVKTALDEPSSTVSSK